MPARLVSLIEVGEWNGHLDEHTAMSVLDPTARGPWVLDDLEGIERESNGIRDLAEKGLGDLYGVSRGGTTPPGAVGGLLKADQVLFIVGTYDEDAVLLD